MNSSHHHKGQHEPPAKKRSVPSLPILILIVAGIIALLLIFYHPHDQGVLEERSLPKQPLSSQIQRDTWIDRALAVSTTFHKVYTPCWEGAYGAIGDAYLFAVTHDSSLYLFHLIDHDLRQMCDGTWVDDRAWVCLAELKWWEVTGKSNMGLILDAKRRYDEAREQGRFSNREGYWTWYNWPFGMSGNEHVFTNSNMNQMVTGACGLYEATGDARYKQDALLAWNGDDKSAGIEATWYRGNGNWVGKGGRAAFGNQLPWRGAGYCSVAAALYRMTGDAHYKDIAVATARRVLDPAAGWVDPVDFYQLHMDGNGAFVNFLLDAYGIAPKVLAGLPSKVELMLEHVWTNGHGKATVVLHRLSDNGIRNGWNLHGGEDGYGVDEVGTVHAQGEAARAFGVFTYYDERGTQNQDSSRAHPSAK